MELADYRAEIMDCPLFAGVGEGELGRALELLSARVRRLSKGELIVRRGEVVTYAHLVLAGEVAGSFASEAADEVDMERFAAGDLFGDVFCCMRETSPVQARAATDCTLLALDVSRLLDGQDISSLAQLLVTNLARSLATKSLVLNRKVRILSERSLRARVRAYLSGLPVLEDGAVVVTLTGTELARYLGVNRSALSRELGRMEDDGTLIRRGERFYLTR